MQPQNKPNISSNRSGNVLKHSLTKEELDNINKLEQMRQDNKGNQTPQDLSIKKDKENDLSIQDANHDVKSDNRGGAYNTDLGDAKDDVDRHYECDDGECIGDYYRNKRCDGRSDCGDGSDERNCTGE